MKRRSEFLIESTSEWVYLFIRMAPVENKVPLARSGNDQVTIDKKDSNNCIKGKLQFNIYVHVLSLIRYIL